MADMLTVSDTLEDYLEAISRLIAEKGVARVRDIAKALSVHKSTVSSALKSLSEKGLVNHSPYELITLTPRGRNMAEEVVRKHKLISRFLEEVLLVEESMAEANACRMEHVLDKEVMERLQLFAKFVKECPRAGEDWLGRFGYYFEHGGKSAANESALEEWIDKSKEKLERRKQERKIEGTMRTLDELKPGQRAKILRVGSVGAVKRRIVDMGVVRGTPIEVIKVAPLGDPIEVKVKGYNLSLRKEEARAITVEPE